MDNYFLVHAGFDFEEDQLFTNKGACLWERNCYDDIDYNKLGNRIIVHGHTPISQTAMTNQFDALKNNKGIICCRRHNTLLTPLHQK